MAKKINVKGVIIPNDLKWIYDWFEVESTSPNDIINALPTDNSPVEVVINSGGGDVYAGSEIYATLKEYAGDSVSKIVGVAASAASVIAMGTKRTVIAPTAQIMIHNVSSRASGDYRNLQHEAEVLKNYNTSIANAYRLKTGKSQEELLELMDNETWFNAQQALEYKFVDEIMFQNETPQFAASVETNGMLPQNVINKLMNMKHELFNQNSEPIEPKKVDNIGSDFLMQQNAIQAKLNLLKLKGDVE